ncbi:hypothetical protein [Sphingobacterium faecium]|uniref:hypothetical protein n=1 Tax=Sphingobacterium faecium TaxID=34087 RepID=UPI00320AE8B4
MKTLKSKLSVVVVAIIGIIAMSFTVANNVPTEVKSEVKASTTYHYTDTENPGVFNDPANWEEGSGSCGSIGTKPCDIEVPENTDLETMLEGKSNSEVLAINPSSRRN